MLSKTKVKYIQSLGHKKRRDEDGVFIAEGPKIVKELLSIQRVQPVEIFAFEEWAMHTAIPRNVELNIITPEELEKITQLSTPHQVLGIFKQFKNVDEIITKNKWVLMLDGIQDPGNIGTIIRIADWFGIEQIICSHACSNIYNPKVIQSSMASMARVGVMVTELTEWINDHPGNQYFAATLDGEKITGVGRLKEGILMIGNESKGLDESLIKKANRHFTIPRIGKAESLNAAVATGIILSHLIDK